MTTTTLYEQGITYIGGHGTVKEVRKTLGIKTHRECRGGDEKEAGEKPAPNPQIQSTSPASLYSLSEETQKCIFWAYMKIEYCGG
jgi:hypothetical protein